MSYRLVKGYFHLHYRSEFRFVGSRPDGDSMWFKPDTPALLANLGGRDVDYNGGGFAQLRFEAIDALELPFGGSHQKTPECVASRDRLLKLAGFTDVSFAPSSTGGIDMSVRTAHPRKGYVMTRNVDPYGRPSRLCLVETPPTPMAPTYI